MRGEHRLCFRRTRGHGSRTGFFKPVGHRINRRGGRRPSTLLALAYTLALHPTPAHAGVFYSSYSEG